MNDITSPTSVEVLTTELAEVTETNKTNAANYKQAKAYTKSMIAHAKAADEAGQVAADADVVTATETEAGWKAAVEAGKEAVKTGKAALAAAKKANKPVKAPKVARETANGVMRPKAEGLCGQCWDLFDGISAGGPVKMAEAVAVGTAASLNDATVRTQYNRWRKFNGHAPQGRKPAPVAAPPAETATA
jgi:hypothetical protein